MICLRSITIDGDELEFTGGFTDLHTVVYKDILSGGGYGIDDAYPSIDNVYRIRFSNLLEINDFAHPLVFKLKGIK
jgi:UDP-N-acetyl-2-amino-2-deoxyglucuronate dehydrogenase